MGTSSFVLTAGVIFSHIVKSAMGVGILCLVLVIYTIFKVNVPITEALTFIMMLF